MARPLTASEAAAAMRRGKEVEQFVRLNDGVLTFLTASQSGREFVVHRHVVRDVGAQDFRDISAFPPVDDEQYVGEGVCVVRCGNAEQALREAAAVGGSLDAWVNQGMAAQEYWRARSSDQ